MNSGTHKLQNKMFLKKKNFSEEQHTHTKSAELNKKIKIMTNTSDYNRKIGVKEPKRIT